MLKNEAIQFPVNEIHKAHAYLYWFKKSGKNQAKREFKTYKTPTMCLMKRTK